MADCEHGFPTPAACIECMAEGPMPKPRPKREGWPFTANYDGTCGGCSDGTKVGDRIVHMTDGTYRHVGDCERVQLH